MTSPLRALRVTSITLSVALSGCRFEEPAPSKDIYLAAVAPGIPRPDDHLESRRRPVAAPPPKAVVIDPRCNAAPADGTVEVLRRQNVHAFCRQSAPDLGAVGAAAATIVGSMPANTVAQGAPVRVKLGATSWEVCVPATSAVSGTVTVQAARFVRYWARGPYDGLAAKVSVARGRLPEGATLAPGGATWLVLPCDPGTAAPGGLAGAVELELAPDGPGL
ncbi:MAG: hypothetical protein IV100_00010 [Myxococcales bacterium]|nr:hypothetical protein [Myxococcales bacterium]